MFNNKSFHYLLHLLPPSVNRKDYDRISNPIPTKQTCIEIQPNRSSTLSRIQGTSSTDRYIGTIGVSSWHGFEITSSRWICKVFFTNLSWSTKQRDRHRWIPSIQIVRRSELNIFNLLQDDYILLYIYDYNFITKSRTMPKFLKYIYNEQLS